ncbi:MAG: hypothetical protein EXR69_16655 [Myxococcales bacterium]|nr:hypothetical protein [Myxococcales bacterium]
MLTHSPVTAHAGPVLAGPVLAGLLLAGPLLFGGCTGSPGDSGPPIGDSAPCDATAYDVLWSTDPSPMSAGAEAQYTQQVVDQDGCAVGNLQQNHDRFVHSIFVSSDLSSFTHTHQEDFVEVTSDNLRTATFSFPLTLPLSGRYFTMFDYAAKDQWLQTDDDLTVTGEPAQAASPDLVPNTTATADGMTATIVWTAPAIATYEAGWEVALTLADGTAIDDVTPWLGADAHCVVVDAATTWGSHTHAWFPDMGGMTPTMDMPHLYDGSAPIPFVFTFPAAGTYKMWIQYTRSADPSLVYAMPFVFTVAG